MCLKFILLSLTFYMSSLDWLCHACLCILPYFLLYVVFTFSIENI
uniref:Uncharacterized protein n=1 Tax=Rhizophora mucronata TaxID=61149 RepID=A0A2P2Q9N5_RHIMU